LLISDLLAKVSYFFGIFLIYLRKYRIFLVYFWPTYIYLRKYRIFFLDNSHLLISAC
jgi:hypothetical protein